MESMKNQGLALESSEDVRDVEVSLAISPPKVTFQDTDMEVRTPDSRSSEETSRKIKIIHRTISFADDATDNTTVADLRAMHREYSKQGLIDLNMLPEYVAKQFRRYDHDGDGIITVTELVKESADSTNRDKKIVHYRRLVAGFVVLWVVTLGCIMAIQFAIVKLTNQYQVDDNGDTGPVMTNVDGTAVVQTANSDFYVSADGSMRVRTSDAESEADTAGVLRTATATDRAAMTSQMPDEVLMELKTITATSSTGATIHLTILGMLRMPPADPAHPEKLGSVTFITHIGRIMIDGSSLYYYDDTDAAIFQTAGFYATEVASADGSRRKLLSGVRALFGVFNAVVSVSKWYNTTTAYKEHVPPPKLPNNFIMRAFKRVPCVYNMYLQPSPSAANFVANYTGGGLPLVNGVDYCDMLHINETELVTTYNTEAHEYNRYIIMGMQMFRFGEKYLRIEYFHPLLPNTTYVEVLDNSNPENPAEFHYNALTSDRGFEAETVYGQQLKVFVGPIFNYNTTSVTKQNLVDEALSAPFDYLGQVQLNNETVRVWHMSLMGGNSHGYWYDSAATQQVRRMHFSSFGTLDVDELIVVNDTDVHNYAYLFAQPVPGVTEIFSVTNYSASRVDPNNVPALFNTDPWAPYIAQFNHEYRTMNLSSSNSTSVRRTLSSVSDAPLAATSAATAVGPYLQNGGRASILTVNRDGSPYSPRHFDALGNGNKCNACGTYIPYFELVMEGIPNIEVLGDTGGPCYFAASHSPDEPVATFPFVEVSVAADMNIQLCSGLTGVSSLGGGFTVTVAPEGMSAVPPPVSGLFEYQVVRVSVNALFQKNAGFSCDTDKNNNVVSYKGTNANKYLEAVSSLTNRKSICNCLQNPPVDVIGIQWQVVGPYVPGSVFALFFLPVAALLFYVRLTPTATVLWNPYFCELTSVNMDVGVTLSLELSSFFTWSTNVWSLGFDMVRTFKSLPPKLVGKVLGMTGNDLDAFAKAALIDAFKQMQAAINGANIAWQTILAANDDLSQAAKKYYSDVTASGAAVSKDMKEIFSPSNFDSGGKYVGKAKDTANNAVKKVKNLF